MLQVYTQTPHFGLFFQNGNAECKVAAVEPGDAPLCNSTAWRSAKPEHTINRAFVARMSAGNKKRRLQVTHSLSELAPPSAPRSRVGLADRNCILSSADDAEVVSVSHGATLRGKNNARNLTVKPDRGYPCPTPPANGTALKAPPGGLMSYGNMFVPTNTVHAEPRDTTSCPAYPLNLAWGCAYQDACFSFRLGQGRLNFLGLSGCPDGTICCPGPCGHRCLTPV
ncbi:hypothetical protein Bbelb_216410 [Branchiostoma belcheri]|nr:hypothetical protein Bbelb_216410 [Branchiostoma belcheri]